LNLFVPNCNITPIEQEIEKVCGAFDPFVLRLDRVASETHWRRPHLKTVLLVSGEKSTDGYRTLVRLHSSLATALAPLKHDLFPEVSQRPHVPHLSLTWGLPEAAAARLAKAAEASHLEAEFLVEEIWLLGFTQATPAGERQGIYSRKAFRL